jgi:SRSO17 transposase
VSCGVARQHTGSAGKVANCQIGVFAAYVSRFGHCFIDRRLYLPRAWAADPERLTEAHIPADTGFATKPAIARRMIERAVVEDIPPFLRALSKNERISGFACIKSLLVKIFSCR